MKFACLFLLFTTQCLAGTFHFSSIHYLAEQEIGRIVLPQIYQRLGHTIEITPLPAKRAQLAAVSGQLHGEIMRIYTYGEENPSVIRVPTPYYSLETMAFVHVDRNLKIDSKDDLASLFVAKIRGVKHTNNITEGLTQVLDMSSTEDILKMVNSGKVDVALTNTIDGFLTIKKLGLKKVVAIDKPLATLDLYHYLHKRYQYLIPELDKTIREMQRDGSLQALISAAETKVLNQ